MGAHPFLGHCSKTSVQWLSPPTLSCPASLPSFTAPIPMSIFLFDLIFPPFSHKNDQLATSGHKMWKSCVLYSQKICLISYFAGCGWHLIMCLFCACSRRLHSDCIQHYKYGSTLTESALTLILPQTVSSEAPVLQIQMVWICQLGAAGVLIAIPQLSQVDEVRLSGNTCTRRKERGGGGVDLRGRVRPGEGWEGGV